MNNFYNEWPHAKSLASSVPVSGVVPRAARLEWVKVITKCHIGNGYGYREGVDTSADRFYEQYIDGFGEAEVVQFLRLFNDPDFTVDFDSAKPDRRAKALATRLKDKTKNVLILRAVDSVLAQPEGTLRRLSVVTKFKEALKGLPNSA